MYDQSCFFWDCSHHGDTKIMLGEQSVDFSSGWLAGVPMVSDGTYEHPCATIRNSKFEKVGLSPMRGSKRGIQITHGNRVSEYDYFRFEWLGKRFAKHVNKTGKLIVKIGTGREFHTCTTQSRNICIREFVCGFNDVISNKKLNAKIIQDHSGSKWQGPTPIYSDVYLICYEGSTNLIDSRELMALVGELTKADILAKANKG